MDVLHVAAETGPWSKTGGLGDVASALPKALAKRGHRVVAVSPRYKEIPGAKDTGLRARFHLFGVDHEVRYHALESDGVVWVFVDNPCFTRGGIYGDSRGSYPDNLFRYALLTRAAIDVAARLPLVGGPLADDTVFHSNDWHTALLPSYLEAWRQMGRFTHAATVHGLHNCSHHGTAPSDSFAGLDLPLRFWPVLDMHGYVNPLKAGIVSADRLVTVSPTYAREITRTHGFGLEHLLAGRREQLVGILNGVDDAWDPKTDKHLPANFDVDDLSGKLKCKLELQRSLGLPVEGKVPLVSMIARLDHQKGIDLVEAITPWLMAQGAQLVMLGSGSEKYKAFFRETERRWPRQARGWYGFDESLAHKIEAGSDIFLMPSRFEPCGLNQMYSLRYGTVPVVHRTGGLADTVQSFDPDREVGTGWAFSPHDAGAFRDAIGFALVTWGRFPESWRRMQRRGMSQDFSWDRAGALYERLYAWAASSRRS